MWRSSIRKDSNLFIGYACHGFRAHRTQTFQTQRAQSKGPCAQSCKPSGKSEIDSVVLTTDVTSISYSCTRKDDRRSTTRHSRARYSANADTFSKAIDASYTISNTHGHIYSAFKRLYRTSSTNGTDGVQPCGFCTFYRTRGDGEPVGDQYGHQHDRAHGYAQGSESGFIKLYFASGAQDNCRSESGRSSNPSVPLPPAAFLSADLAMHALPPLTLPMRPPIYTVPPPTVPPVINAQAPVSTMDQFPFQAPQPQICFSYPALPPPNILPTEPSMPTQAAPPAPPINFLSETETEQERRMKKMEETIKALQAGSSRLDYSNSDWNIFPGMRLPPKIKIPDFKRYHRTKDPRHHLRHYQSKML
ncbi:hypothetical protein CRG98_046523 [Punica granatum]|uniref:Uncharacterized protein n=1 Tax=Punica granatum TaxID=22663 RepID=A0A2I0HPA3_PUNGR|nr:hypothetical protein CRG98_046523 [Punica granatum]